MEASSLFYKVAPLSSNDTRPYPTLILLHGRGTDENDLLGLASAFDPRLLIVSVRAPYRFPYGGYTWFDLDEQNGVNTDQLMEGCGALIQCLDDIQQKYSVDSKRVFLFGFSMGAMMSLTVSLSNPHRFKGVVAHSGLLPQEDTLKYRWNDLDEISFFIAHGTYDPIVPVEFGRQAHQRFMDAKADVFYCEYPIQHTISEESLSDAADWLQRKI
ncbi:MAG: alpha/beta hydrolase-fold protein [Ignavibacteriales bacterium]|nr:alpha/beta hydrolase-fold protein [Ignavibacteriales bacterium]